MSELDIFVVTTMFREASWVERLIALATVIHPTLCMYFLLAYNTVALIRMVSISKFMLVPLVPGGRWQHSARMVQIESVVFRAIGIRRKIRNLISASITA